MTSIDEIISEEHPGENQERFPWVVLVCGVDVVNSSGIKMNNPGGWYDKFSKFFSGFERTLRNKDKNDGDGSPDAWNLWRVVGDELIYYRIFEVQEISSEYNHLQEISADVYRYVYEFTEAIESVSKAEDIHLHGYSFLLDEDKGERYELGDFRFNFIPRNYDPHDPYYANNADDSVLYPSVVISKHKGDIIKIKEEVFVDFVGRGVDQGFRLAEYSSINKFILSPKLVYCLCEFLKNENNLLERIYFLGSYRLKGCGNEKGGVSNFPLYFLMIDSNGESMHWREVEYYKSIKWTDLANKKSSIKDAARRFIEEERKAYLELRREVESSNIEIKQSNNKKHSASSPSDSSDMLNP